MRARRNSIWGPSAPERASLFLLKFDDRNTMRRGVVRFAVLPGQLTIDTALGVRLPSGHYTPDQLLSLAIDLEAAYRMLSRNALDGGYTARTGLISSATQREMQDLYQQGAVLQILAELAERWTGLGFHLKKLPVVGDVVVTDITPL